MLRQGIARISTRQVRCITPSVNRVNYLAFNAAKHTPTRVPSLIFQAVRAISSQASDPKKCLPRQLALCSSRSFATQVSENPFLNWQLFPDFQNLLTQCNPATAVPIFEKYLDNAEQQFKQLEANFTPTWEGSIGLGEIYTPDAASLEFGHKKTNLSGLILPIMLQVQKLEDDISRAYGILAHFNGVKNSDDIRKTLEILQPKIVKLGLQLNQSLPKYNALVKLRDTESSWNALDATQKRIVEQTLRDMKHAGVGFAPGSPEKKRFNEIRERLSKLSLTFGNNVLDATKAYKEVVDKSHLPGLSEKFLETLSNNAKRLGIEHKCAYCITLDFPIYGPFMQNCSNRALREKVYLANIAKASEGKVNNEPIINEILALRQEEAELLGYKTYADLSLSVKMAQNVPAAEELLDKLFDASVNPAKAELSKLTEYATQIGHPTPLAAWDITYISEQYRKHLFKYDEETIAQYFALPKVLDGLFAVAREVLGIDVEEMDAAEQRAMGITTWHKDVKVFKVTEKGDVRAYFYGDFYSRPEE
jgi:oligopeptidase A